jgi:hypothetical protein
VRAQHDDDVVDRGAAAYALEDRLEQHSLLRRPEAGRGAGSEHDCCDHVANAME